MRLLPEVETEELSYIQHITEGMDQNELELFADIYRTKRHDPKTILAGTLLGFFLIAGVQRLMLGQILWAILYFLTGGFCGIGTILDLIKFKKLTFNYNRKVADDTARVVDESARYA